jgi:hypothetical protein
VTTKLAKIDVNADGDVVTVQYRDGTEADAPDLTGFMPEMVSEVVAKLGYGHKPVIYLDSHGVWDEVVLNAGEFAGFRSLGVVCDRDAAIKRVLQLRGMMEDNADNPVAQETIRLLTIHKDNNGKPRPVKKDGAGPMTDDDLMEKLAEGLTAAVHSRARAGLHAILDQRMRELPTDQRGIYFAVFDKISADYDALLTQMAPKIAGMLMALTGRGEENAELRRTAEEAKTASKH